MDPNKRPDDMVRITTPELAQAFIDEQVAAVREQIGDKKVLLALSGGVDSSVVAALLIKAIGKQLICVHVNHGLMRKGESEQVIDVFKNQLDANLVYVDATDRFLGKLVDVEEPEAKRKIIGAEFIRVFEEEARKVGIDIATVNKYYDLAQMQDELPASVRDHYLALEVRAGDCTGCAACEPNCPFGVPIAERMAEAAALFGA